MGAAGALRRNSPFPATGTIFAWPKLLVDPVSRQSLYIYFADWQTSGGGAGIRFIRSTDGGLTWGQPITVVAPGQAASTEFGLVVNPKTGNFHLAYVQPGSLYGIAAMTSTDRGATWSSPVRFVTNVSTSVSMALTSDGTIAVMHQSFGLSAGYSMMTSVDGGLTWNRPVQVAAVDASIAPNNFLGDYLFDIADRGGAFGIAYANTFPGVRPSAAVYYTDLKGPPSLLSGSDPFAGCTINPLP